MLHHEQMIFGEEMHPLISYIIVSVMASNIRHGWLMIYKPSTVYIRSHIWASAGPGFTGPVVHLHG